MIAESDASNWQIFRSEPVLVRGELVHRYLDNRISRLSEASFGRVFNEQPRMAEEMRAMLTRLESTFIVGYDPAPIVDHLLSLRSLKGDLRKRLLDAVGREFLVRFRPHERLSDLRQKGGAFLAAFEAWREKLELRGIGAESAPHWNTLRDRTRELIDLLRDPELRTRWIP
jgi:hypothetical protein